jgi:hypothetical protein
MPELQRYLAAAQTSPEQIRLETQIEITDRAIDRLVDRTVANRTA